VRCDATSSNGWLARFSTWSQASLVPAACSVNTQRKSFKVYITFPDIKCETALLGLHLSYWPCTQQCLDLSVRSA
jgi:hypothetical protein